MKSQQQLKAEARKSARSAPKPDPKRAEAAKAEAAAFKPVAETQPAYPKQTKPNGDLIHRGSGVAMSEFSDPAANTVQAAKKSSQKD